MQSFSYDAANYAPIPHIFHSTFDGPFKSCIVCQRDLTPIDEEYGIHKDVFRKETIVEFAMCLRCGQDINTGMSPESRQRMTAHIEERVDLDGRIREMRRKGGMDVDLWIEECVLAKKKRDECVGYSLLATCSGPYLLFTHTPLMISCDAAREINKLLSKATRDYFDDFTEKFLGMPPELLKDPERPPLIFV